MYASPFIDETFDIDNCHNYMLSIRCAPDGFYFSILDLIVNKLIVFTEYDLNAATPFQLKNEVTEILGKETILQQNFKSVNISYSSREIVLAPQALFNPEEVDALFHIHFESNRNNEIIVNKTTNDIVLLAALPKIIKDLLLNHFPNARFFTAASALFHYNTHLASNQNRLLVQVDKHMMYLLYSKGNTIQMVNAFFVKNETDSLYYILNTMKQLQADHKTELLLLGHIQQNSTLPKQLRNYFEHVNFARFSHQYTVSYTFHQEPEHYHLATTELALCE
ncbi:MAG: DUF3822 family protein [Prolixibacteraceae bacterium]